MSPSAWLNNCVGHFNHRYFFSFCLFMTLGCVYCSISGRNLFLDAYNALEVSSSVYCNFWLLGCFVLLISSVTGPNYCGFPIFKSGLFMGAVPLALETPRCGKTRGSSKRDGSSYRSCSYWSGTLSA